MAWIALKHALLSHLPVATGLLLPLALLAAQRPGRGIRPWWTVSRYIGWTGLFGVVGAVLSGLALGRLLGLVPVGHLLPMAAAGTGAQALLFRHALLASGSLALAVGAVWAMHRSRQHHQSLGLLALLLGLAWCAALLLTGQSGYHLAHRRVQGPAPVVAPAPAAMPATRAQSDPEAEVPVRMLDHASLDPIHAEPVKSLAHGGRWIRAWANAKASVAYAAGQPLPQGSLVVLSSVEDRWGRPGPEVGPLYALEQKASGPALTFYWPRVPRDRRREVGGEARVYWREGDPRLEACRTCHPAGMADPARRSRWRAKRIVPGE